MHLFVNLAEDISLVIYIFEHAFSHGTHPASS